MPIYSFGDVVRVPFPYTDRSTRQHRPALVVSEGEIGLNGSLLIVVMITSAENRSWPDDVPIADFDAAGLPVASIIRPCKLATIDVAHAEPLGRIPAALAGEVKAVLRRQLGI